MMVGKGIYRWGLGCLFFWVMLFSIPQLGHSTGTLAGTTIDSIANLSYIYVGSSDVLAKDSNIVTSIINEVLDLDLVWLDASYVAVTSGDAAIPLTFVLTNTGNGSEFFSLVVENSLAGDEFDPTFDNIYLDTDDNGLFDAATDALYLSGINDPILEPDESLTIFVLNDIPATGLTGGDTGKIILTAFAMTGSGVPGTDFAGLGQESTDAVVGLTGAIMAVPAGYQIGDTSVAIVKSAEVIGGPDGLKAVSGAIIKYTLAVTVSGSGTTLGVVITDPVPPLATYVVGSLTLNGNSLTDIAGDDDGDFSGTIMDTVNVVLGDMTAATPEQIITFNVSIN